jgi:hypothetical protein
MALLTKALALRSAQRDSKPPGQSNGGASPIPIDTKPDLSEHIADLSHDWRERFAVIVESGDVSELEAQRIADTELGAAFRLRFMPSER